MSEHGQKILRLMAPQREPALASDQELCACKSFGIAMRNTLAGCGLEQKQIAAQVGVGTPMLSRFLNGSRMLHPKRWARFIEATGSMFWLQFALWQMGYRVTKRDLTVEEKAQLWDEQQRSA